MKKNSITGVLISLIVGLFIFFVGINVQSDAAPKKVYKVYLNGETIGLIYSEKDLINLIDNKQEQIKIKYGVDKVHPPSGLDVKEEYTYSDNIKTPEEVYAIIQGKDPFTISGYEITIDYPDELFENEVENTKSRETVHINVLRKSDFKVAFEKVIRAFVGTDEYELFINETQPEIIDVGSNIETIYWEESIAIKEKRISVDSVIFENCDEISKYLLFSTTDKQETYITRDGDDISSISLNNKLNTDEFLIANPDFKSKHILLTPGQTVNIGLIDPLVTITAEMHVIEDITNRYKTEYIDDNQAYYGTEKKVQDGSDGVTRVVEKVLYRNGDINNLIIVNSNEIKPVINEVVSRGTKGYFGSDHTYYNNSGNDSWSWPTLSPCIITSRFEMRWGKHHDGIDISGTGERSPIFATGDGVVVIRQYGSGFGNYVVVNHENGYLTLYAHLAQTARYDVGTRVKRGQVIGLMGNTGFSTGTHLHFSVILGDSFTYNSYVDPCKSMFSC